MGAVAIARQFKNSIAAEIFLAIAICGYCVIVFFYSMNLGMLRFDVPLIYQGDALQYSYMIEAAAAPGGLGHIANTGAPFSTQNLDFPNADAANLLIARSVAGDGEFGRRFNLFFLAGVVLTSLSGFGVARSIGLSRLWSTVIAVCFTLLPFHFMRVGHLFYTNYSAAAVAFWLCVRIGAIKKSAQMFSLPKRILSGIFFFLACVWCGSTGVYYAFFSCLILVLAAIINAVHQKSRTPLLFGALALSLVALSTAAQIAPTTMFEIEHGKNDAVAKRLFQESEIYGLRISQLLLPTLSHPIPQFAKVKQTYNSGAPLMNENDTAMLGVVGSLGFLAAITLLLLPGIQRRLRWEIRLAAFLLLVMLLYATIGGFGSLFALLVTPQIRALNRISPFIDYASLIVGIGILQHLLSGPRSRIYGAVLAVLIVPAATCDEVVYRGQALIGDYENNRILFDADKQFASALSASVDKGARVMQLPFVEYPESGSVIEYAQFRNQLHAPQLNWTYGAMKGRPESNWLHLVSALNPSLFLETLTQTGFSAIVLDTRAPSALTDTLIKPIVDSPTSQKISSTNAVQIAYVFAPHAVATARALAPYRNWYGAESNGSQTWIWGAGNASLELSPANRPSDCRATISLKTIRARKIEAWIDGVNQTTLMLADGEAGDLHLNLSNTSSHVELKTDVAAAAPNAGEARAIAFGWQIDRPPTCVFMK
jgi:phosphoglycerol transferase